MKLFNSHAGLAPILSSLCLPSGNPILSLFPDPRKSGLVELILQVGIGQLTEQQKDTLVRQLAVLLNVLDSDIKVQKIQAHSDLRYEPHTNPARSCSFPRLVLYFCAHFYPIHILFFSKGSSKGNIIPGPSYNSQ